MDSIRISTISSKGQTTVPVAIRRSLDLHPGDAIAYRVEGDKVSICKAAKIDLAWAKALEQTLRSCLKIPIFVLCATKRRYSQEHLAL